MISGLKRKLERRRTLRDHPLDHPDIISSAELRLGLPVAVFRHDLHLKRKPVQQPQSPEKRQLTDTVCHAPQPVQPLRLRHPVIDIVTAEKFVSPVPGEHDGHIPRGQLRHQHRRDLRAVCKGLVIVLWNALNHVKHGFLVDIEFRVPRTQMPCDLPGVPGLVIALLVKTDGIRPHRLTAHILCERSDQRRVITAAQEGAHRNVRDHSPADRLLQDRLQFRLCLLVCAGSLALLCVVHLCDIPVFVL